MSNPSRVQAGVPTGGQFAAGVHAESEMPLTQFGPVSAGFDDCCSECGASLDDGPGRDGLCGRCADQAEDGPDQESGAFFGNYVTSEPDASGFYTETGTDREGRTHTTWRGPNDVRNDHPDGSPSVEFRRADATVSSQTFYTDGDWTKTTDFYPDGRVAAEFNIIPTPTTPGATA